MTQELEERLSVVQSESRIHERQLKKKEKKEKWKKTDRLTPTR